jgi:tetratricopeptide (TPR) repeat protein
MRRPPALAAHAAVAARRARFAAVVLGLVAAASCAPALREPRPLPAGRTSRSADALLAEGDAAWTRRAQPGQAAAAADLYAEAASADDQRVDGLLAAMAALAFQAERERDGATREQLAARAVELGQWCQRRAPEEGACDYRLAVALGQLARERTSAARDAVDRMVVLLRRAASRKPRLDSAGPHRVLALVLARAPAWPLGPGDPDAAVEEARAAVALFPDAPQNQLALAEALEKAERADEARAAYERALSLASRVDEAREPEVVAWRDEAKRALARGAPP